MALTMLSKRTAVLSSASCVARSSSITPLSLALRATSVRFYSAGMSKGDDPNHPQKELTPFQKLQKWMQPFVDGGKALYQENKQAWAIRSRLKNAGGDLQLTRQEMMILRQAHRDLVKSLPLLVFFAVPLVGYAAPLVGYQFPKQLLPWQFWRADQKSQFFREDAHARATFYPELVQILTQIDHKEAALKELLQTAAANKNSDGSRGAGHGSARGGLNPAQVSELVPFFDASHSGPAALPVLSRHHVQVLARSIALVPAFSWVWQFVPRATVESFVERRVDQLRVDDAMLLKEGIDALSLSELEFACEERGIVDGYGNIEALRVELGDWLAMYDTTSDNTVAVPGQFPSSLLLHAPALMNPRGRQD